MQTHSFAANNDFINRLKKEIPLTTLVEVKNLKNYSPSSTYACFEKVYCIDPAEGARNVFKKGADANTGLSVETREHLKDIVNTLRHASVLYVFKFLNPKVSKKYVKPENAVLNILSTLGTLNESSILIIDKAIRFIKTAPGSDTGGQYPSLDELFRMLFSLSQQHYIQLVDDAVVFYPKKNRTTILNYLLPYNLDIEKIYARSQQLQIMQFHLRAKEQKIQELHQENIMKANLLKDTPYFNGLLPQQMHSVDLQVPDIEQKKAMEMDVQAQLLELNMKMNLLIARQRQLKFHRLNFNMFFKKHFSNRLKPKLGSLFHYNPITLIIPEHYRQNIFLRNPPKISIVTPSFRQGAFIEETICSVVNQNYPNLEYVVQDGGSQDETTAILEKYNPRLHYWESKKDTGQSNAINLGFQHTSGEIMAYLNSDDLLLPGSLEYIANYFQKHPEVDVVYGHRVLINENGLETGRWVLPPHNEKVLKYVDFVPQETLFWRRRIWDKVGGKIDENFQFAMDWDLLLRFQEAGAKIIRLPRFLGAFRVHSNQKTSSTISSTGLAEMDILRARSLGKKMEPRAAMAKAKYYLFRHIILHVLYRLNWIKY